MDLTGLHLFGNLTAKKGSSKTLSFQTINSDGVDGISKTEWDKAARLYNCDTLTFEGLDKNGDGEISEEEFASIQQNLKIQKALDKFVNSNIKKDFNELDVEYLPEMVEALKEFTMTFVEEHDGEEDIEALFQEELAAKYIEVRDELLENSPSKIVSRVRDDVYETLINDDMPQSVKDAVFKEIQTISLGYAQKHKSDDTFEADLYEYVSHHMNTSAVEKMQEAWDKYNEAQDSYKEQVDEFEIVRLKEDAVEFLKAALENNVTVKLGNTKITAKNIESTVNKYKDGAKLRADMQALFDSLSTVSRRDEIVIDATAKEINDTVIKDITSAKTSVSSSVTNLKATVNTIESYYKDYPVDDIKKLLDSAKFELAVAEKLKEEMEALLKEAKELQKQAEEAESPDEAEAYLREAQELLEKANSFKDQIADIAKNTKDYYIDEIIKPAIKEAEEAAENAKKISGVEAISNTIDNDGEEIYKAEGAKTWTVNKTYDGQVNIDSAGKLEYNFKKAGTYEIEITAKDENGNVIGTKAVKIKID